MLAQYFCSLLSRSDDVTSKKAQDLDRVSGYESIISNLKERVKQSQYKPSIEIVLQQILHKSGKFL